MDSFSASIDAYEAWLRTAVGPDFVEADLALKHRKMRSGAFPFLRATYWRWAETILTTCPDLAGAPQVLSIGDTHLENFGTWRDVEGRLIWGANDFDEAAVMPYPLDIVRLAVSALLARPDGKKRKGLSVAEICDAILAGYVKGLDQPQPIVLERGHKWLRKAVVVPEKDRAKFWAKLKLPAASDVPDRFAKALAGAMPLPVAAYEVSHRTAGTGSLGRPRFLANGDWKGGPVLREAKALVVSAWSRIHAPDSRTIRTGMIAHGRFRAPDPHYAVAGGILVRRLSLNSRKIEAGGDAKVLLSPRMLKMMGHEIATCHADAVGRLPAIRRHIERQSDGWFRAAVEAAVRSVRRDFAEYRSGGTD